MEKAVSTKETRGFNPFPSKSEAQLFAEKIGTPANVLVSAGHEPLTRVPKSHFDSLVSKGTKKAYATRGEPGMTLPVLLKAHGR